MQTNLMLILATIALAVTTGASQAAGLKPEGTVTLRRAGDWVILGPFPNPERAEGAKDRGAFDVDYLTSLGHGSASSCILRADLDHDLVIAQIRNTAGPKYAEYAQEFFTTIADSIL